GEVLADDAMPGGVEVASVQGDRLGADARDPLRDVDDVDTAAGSELLQSIQVPERFRRRIGQFGGGEYQQTTAGPLRPLLQVRERTRDQCPVLGEIATIHCHYHLVQHVIEPRV